MLYVRLSVLDLFCFPSTNGFHITLVPYKDGPTQIVDFRPILLLNTLVKILTKILASRI